MPSEETLKNIAEARARRAEETRAKRRIVTNRYRKNNPNHREGHKNYVAEWRKNNPDKYREQHIMRAYGITLVQYNDMLERQGGKCACCRTSEPGKRGWHVDHCHASGGVRGLLCRSCNTALGLVKDSPETLANMIRYLGGNL